MSYSAKKQVAVKVLTDYVTLIQEKHAFELRVMQRISKIPPTHPAFSGTRNLLPLFDHFTYPGVRGDHLCLVTELLGPDLYDITTTKTDKRAALPLDLVKHVTSQLLQAQTTLHEGCQTVHTGQDDTFIMAAYESRPITIDRHQTKQYIVQKKCIKQGWKD